MAAPESRTPRRGKDDPVYAAAEALLVALREDQREHSEAANAYVGLGRKTGPAAYRLRRALKEAGRLQ